MSLVDILFVFVMDDIGIQAPSAKSWRVTFKLLTHYVNNSHVIHMQHRQSNYLNSLMWNFYIHIKLYVTCNSHCLNLISKSMQILVYELVLLMSISYQAHIKFISCKHQTFYFSEKKFQHFIREPFV